MINLIRDFEKHEKAILEYVKARAEMYYTSTCYTSLDRRLNDLQRSNDLQPAALRRNEWASHVVFPIVKERSLLRRAITAANYRANDIFSLTPIGSTPPENAAHSELVLNLNMAHTFFRMKCLKPCIDTASKFGSAVTYTYWKKSDAPKYQTTYNEQTGEYTRTKEGSTHKNSYNLQILLRDYFQNPNVADPDASDYQGHIKKLHISELKTLLNDPQYIKENLGKVIEEAIKHKGTLSAAFKRQVNEQDEKMWGVEILHFEGTVNIKGNEEDETNYFCEVIGNEIVKLSVDNYDDDIRSYNVLNFDKRSEYWWGNPDSEYVVAHENFLNTMLSMTADNALRSMNQYVFFQKDVIDPADINNRIKNQGFIPVDAKDIPINQLLQSFQPGQLNLGTVEYAVNAVNESLQSMSTKVDLSRKGNEGGMNNKTATAANIIAGQSDVLEADILENFDFGVQLIGRTNMILLQQFLSELFYVRPKPQEAEKQLYKYNILGRFQYLTNTTMQKNKQNELLRLQNLVTWTLNIMNSPALAQAGINLIPLVKNVFNQADIPSVDEIIPQENKQLAAPGMVPSNQQTNGAPQGAPQAGSMPQSQQMMGAPNAQMA